MKFKRYLTEAGKAKTEIYETASCMGIVAISQVISDIDKLLSKDTSVDVMRLSVSLLSILKRSEYDWDPTGVSGIKDILIDPSTNYDDFVVVCSLVKGMSDFVKDKGLTGYHFVHKHIAMYYKIEKKRLGEVKGSKANTADCIVCGTDSKTFFKMMETAPIEAKKEHIEVGGIKFYQISLKKSLDGAQLGKVGKFLRQHFDFGVTVGQGVEQLISERFYSQLENQLLTENFFKRIKDVAASLFNKIKLSIKKTLNVLSKKYANIFSNKVPTKHLNRLYKELNINEATLKKVSGKNLPRIEALMKDPNKILSKVNDQIKQLIKISNATDYIQYNYTKLSSIKNSPDNIQDVYSLIANYCTVLTLQDLLKDGKQLSSNIRWLLAEMFFGGTSLPLWKVYGSVGSGPSYEFMGTVDTFIEADKTDTVIDLIGWRLSPIGNHYATNLLILDSIDKTTKKYITFRMGTNSSSNISFAFEGTGYKTIEVNESLNKLL